MSRRLYIYFILYEHPVIIRTNIMNEQIKKALWGSERSSNLSKVTYLVSGTPEFPLTYVWQWDNFSQVTLGLNCFPCIHGASTFPFLPIPQFFLHYWHLHGLYVVHSSYVPLDCEGAKIGSVSSQWYTLVLVRKFPTRMIPGWWLKMQSGS